MVNVGALVAICVMGATPPPTATQASTPTLTATASAEGPTLSLTDALAELDRQNLTMAQARARADEAGGVSRQAASALLPTLSAAGSYLRNSDQVRVSLAGFLGLPANAGPNAILIQPLDALSATGTLRVPLLVPSAWFDLAQARDAARAADASAVATRAQVRTSFTQGAYTAAAAEDIVDASERAVQSAAELSRSADRQVAAGTAAPLDSLRAKTEQVRRESDLAAARANLGRARLALGVLLGREGPVRIALPVAADAPEGPVDALEQEGLAHRPELDAARAQRDAADEGVRSAWARLAPQLSATGSAFTQNVPLPTGKEQGWRASVDLSWPLYDGGFRYGKRRQAEAQRAQADASAEAQRLQVLQEVQDAVRDLDVARERLRLAETQRQLASDAAASARRSFEAGILSSLDVIDANDRLYTSDINLADARARLGQSRVALERAVGR
jgi:outer membrane protein TolC